MLRSVWLFSTPAMAAGRGTGLINELFPAGEVVPGVGTEGPVQMGLMSGAGRHATGSWRAGWTFANHKLGSFYEAFSPCQASLPFFGTGKEASDAACL